MGTPAPPGYVGVAGYISWATDGVQWFAGAALTTVAQIIASTVMSNLSAVALVTVLGTFVRNAKALVPGGGFNAVGQLSASSARTRMIEVLCFRAAPLCVVAEAFALGSNAGTMSFINLGYGLTYYFGGFCLFLLYGGVSGARGLIYRTSKAQSIRTFGVQQRAGMMYVPICLAVLAFARSSVADCFKLEDSHSGTVAEKAAQAAATRAQFAFGFILNSPERNAAALFFTMAALGYGSGVIEALLATRAIVAQATRSGLFTIPFALDPAITWLGEAICWQTLASSVIRAKMLNGEFTVPVIVALAWSAVAAAATNSAAERKAIETHLGHTAKLAGIKNSPQTRNHVSGVFFEPAVLRFLKEGLVSPVLLGVAWVPEVREALNELVADVFFGGVRNASIETSARASASSEMWGRVAVTVGNAGNFVLVGGGPAAPTALGAPWTDAALMNLFRTVTGRASPSAAQAVYGNPSSWQTLAMKTAKVYFVQGLLALDTAHIAADLANLWKYDGQSMIPATPGEVATSWAQALITIGNGNNATWAAVSGFPPNTYFGVKDDASIVTYVGLAAKAGTAPFARASPLPEKPLTSGEVYALCPTWVIAAEEAASGFPGLCGSVAMRAPPAAGLIGTECVDVTTRMANMGLTL